MKNSKIPAKALTVSEFREGRPLKREIFVIKETPLSLFIEDREIVTLLYDGSHPKELAVGYFFNEGFFESSKDIKEIEFSSLEDTCRIVPARPMENLEDLYGKKMVTSGCGRGSSYYQILGSIAKGRVKVKSDMAFSVARIQELAMETFKASELRKLTHGVHSAALANIDEIVVFREDIGRHNAVDKIAGRCLLDQEVTSDKMLITTGRLTSELMIKAGRLGCPVVASRSAATVLAVELAEKIGITVLGGVSSKSMIAFCGEQRLIPS